MTKGYFGSIGPFLSDNLPASAKLIVLSPSSGLLLLVILNMTKPFHIGKPVTSADITTATKPLKDIIWIFGVLFSFLDKSWQYMIGISNPAHQLKFAEDVVHYQVLLTEIIDSKYETIARPPKRD